MKKRAGASWSLVGIVQLLVGASLALGYLLSPSEDLRITTPKRVPEIVPVTREEPVRIKPLYDRPEMVSDEDLIAVLSQIVPRFSRTKLKPNYIEHAIRAWGVDAKFQDPEILSGEEMRDFLCNYGKYVASWGEEMEPLLNERQGRVTIRWGRQEGASVHHDHWLACLTEGGVGLHSPVYTPGAHDINDVLQLALSDFRLDERETEWSVMAFGLWIAPVKEWKNAEGRHLSFDLLARRQMRGHREIGVCHGTHRVFSLMMLIRLDDEFQILSPEVRDQVWHHLEGVRDAIKGSQFEDGHWPSNWPDGELAMKKPVNDPLYQQVIATGHHLEWLAIAPEELHPPREQIERATKWIIATTKAQTREEILDRYTFFSHVGAALCLWRSTHPAEFWEKWEANNRN